MNLKERVALVTGGASGIGAATVSLLTAMGSRVASVDIRPSTEAELSIEADVGDEAQMAEAVRRIQEELGLLKLAVLNAGVGSFSPIRSMSLPFLSGGSPDGTGGSPVLPTLNTYSTAAAVLTAGLDSARYGTSPCAVSPPMNWLNRNAGFMGSASAPYQRVCFASFAMTP